MVKYISVDWDSGFVHTVKATAANVRDVQLSDCCQNEEIESTGFTVSSEPLFPYVSTKTEITGMGGFSCKTKKQEKKQKAMGNGSAG